MSVTCQNLTVLYRDIRWTCTMYVTDFKTDCSLTGIKTKHIKTGSLATIKTQLEIDYTKINLHL